MSEQHKPEVRFAFVELLFALTAAEIAVQISDVHSKAGISAIAAPAYVHLLLALILVAASWVGWSVSKAPGATKDVKEVFSADFVVLLIDVLLVIFYFIVVKGVDQVIVNVDKSLTVVASASHEAVWIAVIFGGYFLWDVLTKAIIGDDKAGGITVILHRLCGHAFWDRGWVSTACLALSLITWYVVRGLVSPGFVILSDFALLTLVLLFRALKQPAKGWRNLLVIALSLSLIILYLFGN